MCLALSPHPVGSALDLHDLDRLAVTMKLCCDLVGLVPLIDQHQYLVGGRPSVKSQCVHVE
jgi:hypothetical protein